MCKSLINFDKGQIVIAFDDHVTRWVCMWASDGIMGWVGVIQ